MDDWKKNSEYTNGLGILYSTTAQLPSKSRHIEIKHTVSHAYLCTYFAAGGGGPRYEGATAYHGDSGNKEILELEEDLREIDQVKNVPNGN